MSFESFSKLVLYMSFCFFSYLILYQNFQTNKRHNCVSGKIGTPTLTVLTQGNELKVDIFHPACLPENLLDSCEEVDYLVYFWDHENQVLFRLYI